MIDYIVSFREYESFYDSNECMQSSDALQTTIITADSITEAVDCFHSDSVFIDCYIVSVEPL